MKKEFLQLWNDRAILFIVAWAFTGAIYNAGHSISQELRNYPVGVLDLSQTPESRDLVYRLDKPYFKLVAMLSSDTEVVDYLNHAWVSAALIIPPDFARLLHEGNAKVQVIVDGTMTQSATLASGYIGQIVGRYAMDHYLDNEKLSPKTLGRMPGVDARVRIEYNENITSAWFTSLLEMFNMSTMISMLLAASAMVREKEYGTLEQLLVSPMRASELFIAKIAPPVLVIVLGTIVALYFFVHGVFHTPIRGSLFLFYGVAVIYVFSTASLGLFLALLADNLGQAMMLLLLVMYPMLFLSGAMTPPESMAPWMRYASLISPMRYYIDFGYQVIFKGNGIAYVWRDILGIVTVGAVMFGLAVRRYQRLFS